MLGLLDGTTQLKAAGGAITKLSISPLHGLNRQSNAHPEEQ
jgi:hypothetical protein